MKDIRKCGLGTFTHREKPRPAYKILGIVAAYFTVFYLGYQFVSPVIRITNAYAPEALLNKPTTKLPSDSQSVQIENYIKSVFGMYSDKAFQLLTDPRCHENGTLNPNAVNHNWIKGQPGKYWSTDWGVFQINDYWQKVQPKFLLNWKINVQVAYQLFTENNHTFNLWTCGKELGI